MSQDTNNIATICPGCNGSGKRPMHSTRPDIVTCWQCVGTGRGDVAAAPDPSALLASQPVAAPGMTAQRFNIDARGLPFAAEDGVWVAYQDYAQQAEAAPAPTQKETIHKVLCELEALPVDQLASALNVREPEAAVPTATDEQQDMSARLAAASASQLYFDDATIEAAALKHVATDYHKIAHLIPNYRCTEQFARLKAFAEELTSRAQRTNKESSDLASIASPAAHPANTGEQEALVAELERLHDALCFWLPLHSNDLPDAMQERIAADAYLLVGYEDMPDPKCAEELGWIRTIAAPSPVGGNTGEAVAQVKWCRHNHHNDAVFLVEDLPDGALLYLAAPAPEKTEFSTSLCLLSALLKIRLVATLPPQDSEQLREIFTLADEAIESGPSPVGGSADLLAKLVSGDVGRATLAKLAAGQGTATEDGKNWLAAAALATRPVVEGGSADPITGYTKWMHDSSKYPHSDDTRHPFDAFKAGAEWALASRPAALAAQPEKLRDRVHDALASELSDSYDCTRVWSAWGVGTMGEDDFTPLECRLDDITETVLAALAASDPQQGERNA